MKSQNPLTNSICNRILFFLVILLSQSSIAQQLAFPSAKGAGAYATGGRGGQVIHVTTLDWNAPGGLREAIATPGPRIVVFDVSGEIDATSEGAYTPIISGSQFNDLTIAGQTAPTGGISIRTSEFMFQNVSNVIIRYIRFRNDIGSIQDAFWLTGGSNIIIDHCTFSHGGDESASLGSSVGVMGDITMQNCFFQDSKTGTILGVDNVDGDFTFVDNVYSGISHRFPNPKGDGQYDIINNVVYNWKYRLIRISGEGTYNVMNNYYKPAINGLRQPGWFGNEEIVTFLQKIQTQAGDNPLIHASGSVVTGQRETPLTDDSDMWTVFAGSHLPENSFAPSQYFTDNQFPLVGQDFAIKDASQTYIDVLNNVGADKTLNADGSIYAYRDDKDVADILMIQNDTYNGSFFDDRSIIPYAVIPQNVRPSGFDSNADGMPDLWKASRGFGSDEDISNHVWPSGYVGVEEYLNEIDLNAVEFVDVTSVEVTPDTGTINIPDTIDLFATILPVNATNQSGVWSSSDDAIATVSASGTVTPISEGEVTISFTTNDGGFTGDAAITVTNIVIPLESVSVSPENVTLDLGENLQLITDFLPTNTSDVTGIWTSSDESIVLVNDNGYISTVDIGQVEITFVANDGGHTDSVTITVVDDFFGTYILYNADSDEIIQNIEGDLDVNLANESDQINIRSIPEGGDENVEVESVGVTWTGPTSGSWIESDPIYAGLPSGHVDLNFEPYTVVEGTYNFTVTYYSENSGAGNIVAVDTFSLTFFFDLLPIANAGPDQDICEGEVVILTASGGPNFLWDNSETTASIEVSPLVTTIYTVSVFDDEGNVDEDSVTVTVHSFPTANAGEDQTICEGEIITLTATGGDTFLWSTGETTASIEVSPIVETIYDVEVTSNNCSSTDSVTVNVNPSPNVSVNDDMYLYNGDSTILTVNGATTYLWGNGDETNSITVSPTETTTYTVTGFANGCQSTAEVTVTVIEPINANAGNDVTICSGESVILNATGGILYSWDSGETDASINVSPLQTTTFTVTVTDDLGGTDSASVTVTVHETPEVTINEDVTIIEGESVVLIANGALSYLWNTGETSSTITVSPINTTIYTVTGSSNNCEDTAQVTVTVIPELIANAGDDITICSGESVVLNASGGVTYTWDTGDTGASPTFNPNETTIYTVTVTDGFGNSDSDSVTVTVNELPNVTVSENITIIEGESINLVANGAETYLWNTNETSSTITVSPIQTTTYTVTGATNACTAQAQVTVTVEGLFEASAGTDEHICDNNTYEVVLTANQGDSYFWSTNETTQSIVVSPLSTTTYTVTVTQGQQEDTDDVTIYVDPSPNVVIANGESVDILSGDFITLSASGANTYEWGNGATQPNIAVSPSATTTYEVKGYIGDCYDEKQVTVNVYQPVVADAGEDVYICLDEVATLTATGGDEYVWSTGETTQTIQVSPTETTDYTVTVFNAMHFDEATATVEVDVNCNVEPPLNEPLDFSFDIFPNPASNVVNVKLSGALIISDVYIYDFTGKLVQHTKISNEDLSSSTTTQIDVSALQTGIYLVKLIDQDRDITKKLIVE